MAKDPMKGVIDSDHSQAPRSDVLPDGKEMGRGTFKSADSGYEGPQRMGTFDSCNDPDEWSEKS